VQEREELEDWGKQRVRENLGGVVSVNEGRHHVHRWTCVACKGCRNHTVAEYNVKA
jgi:hypothetical protein